MTPTTTHRTTASHGLTVTPGAPRAASSVAGPSGDPAQSVRAAPRRALPAFRLDGLGFRFARVQRDSAAEPWTVRSKPSERSEVAATNGPRRSRV